MTIMLKGAYTALVTPFTSDGTAVDTVRLADAVGRQAAGGVAGVVPCGTTGESPTLGEREHRQVVEATVEAARGGPAVIAGAGSNCTAHAVELHRFAEEAGADAALHVCPYYNKPTPEGLYRHFAAIADGADLPVVLYNIPGRCGVGLALETIERLARHPNIVAIKEASGSLELAAEIAARTDLVLLAGDDSLTLPMAAVGGAGVVSVVANLVPDTVAELCRACDAPDRAAATALHRRLLPLATGLLRLATNPVPVKTALAVLGRDSGALRLPLCAPPPPVRRRIEELLAEAGLLREAVAVPS